MKRRFIVGLTLVALFLTMLVGCSQSANFSLSNLKIGPGKVVSGEAVAISAFVTNTGGKEGSYTAKLTINGEEEESKSITLAAGESTDVNFSVTRSVTGTYDVTVGDLSSYFVVVQPAAFSLSNLNIMPTRQTTSGSLFVSVTVTNTGGSDGIYDLAYNIDDGPDRNVSSLSLGPDDSMEFSFDLPAGNAGKHKIAVGDLSCSFIVVEPIEISNLAIEPSKVAANEPIDISVSLSNPNESEEACDLPLEIDGIVEETQSIILAPGESKDVTFTVAREDIGDHDVTIGGISGSFTIVEPADLEISSIEFEPYHTVWPNEEVIISVFVRNNNDIEGSRDVVLYINGLEEETKSITLGAHELGSIAFSVSREDIGIYEVAIEGVSAYFSVATPISMKLEVAASTWRDAEPYDIYGAIETKLKIMGIRIVEEGEPYDSLLSVEYEETMHGLYTNFQYGTHIWCTLSLYDSAGKLILFEIITGETPGTVSLASWESLYSEAVTDFRLKDSYKSIGPVIAEELDSEYVFLKLFSDLKDSSSMTRENAVIALGEIPYNVRAVEPLLPLLLGDSSNNVRASVAKALGNILDVLGDQGAVAPLIHALLEDNYSSVRTNAAEALGKIGDVKAVDALEQAFQEDQNAGVRDMAEWALKQIQGG
ncbi:MAG: HEAT repeat domain-containing protein [Dehalococcoidaceae bacterium]|nr:HEAT repeat domain-containing protein [Dehalococcoidaceae bacterium]